MGRVFGRTCLRPAECPASRSDRVPAEAGARHERLPPAAFSAAVMARPTAFTPGSVSWMHAERVLEAGVDSLVLVCADAGGHAGMLSPFALMREK